MRLDEQDLEPRGAVLLPSAGAPSLAAGAKQQEPDVGGWAKGRSGGAVSEVFIQDATSSRRFRRVTADQASKYGVHPEGNGQDRSEAERAPSRGRLSSGKNVARTLASVAAMRAVTYDSESLQLKLADPMDLDVLDLLVRSEQAQSSAGALFFAAQSLLTGLSLITAYLIYKSSSAEKPDETLVAHFEVVEPALSRLSMFCAEVCFVGSCLRFMKSREHVAAFDQFGSLGYEGGYDLDGMQRRRAARSSLHNFVALLCNLTAVVCCIVNGRADAWLLVGSLERRGGVLFAASEDLTQWKNLLIVRSVVGTLGVGFAVCDLMQQLSFALPAHPLPLPTEFEFQSPVVEKPGTRAPV